MKKVIFAILVLISQSIEVSYSSECSCSVFTDETSCLEQSKCVWSELICNARTCSQFATKDKCNSQSTCSWNNGSCSTFTKCSDYYVNDSYDCYLLGNDNLLQWCQPTEKGNTCTDFQYQSCGITEDDCNGFKNYWIMCSWQRDLNKCIEVDVRYCDQLITQELCFIFGEGLGCQWTNSTCSAYTCADLTTESKCVLARKNYITDNPTLCRWNNTICEEAPDVSHLDFSNCFSNSLNNYIWDSKNDVCVSCQDYKPETP